MNAHAILTPSCKCAFPAAMFVGHNPCFEWGTVETC